jgi:hypothetical protein
VLDYYYFFFLFFFFFFYWAPVAGATGCTAALYVYCTILALEAPTCNARRPHAYNDARELYQGKGEL